MTSSVPTSREVTGAELAVFDLFRDIALPDLDDLARHFVELAVGSGMLVSSQGQRSRGLYLIKKGEMAVFRDAVGQPVQLLARPREGEYFGEVALFGTGLSTASVRASTDSLLLLAEPEAFLAFSDRHPSVQLQLQLSATRRHADTLGAVLETGRRREVRIRCGLKVSVDLESGDRLEMVLENLSLGGLCLSGAPESWRVGESVTFGLILREGQLPLEGSVRWRNGSAVGVSFVKRSSRHDMLIQMAIRLIHESAQAL